MSGIFYDSQSRRLRKVREQQADPSWTLVTHNLDAGAHQCRRILKEWVSPEDLRTIDFSTSDQRPN
jgi:hypothetical protein